jgi:hypothetical protein
MITIKLEIASNGVIKTVTDNNYNGAGSKHENRTVYVTDNDKSTGFSETIRFLYDICDDLGINLGNKFDESVLNFELGWGHKYEPSLEQVKGLVKETSKNLKELKEWKADLEKQQKVQDIIDSQNKENVPL